MFVRINCLVTSTYPLHICHTNESPHTFRNGLDLCRLLTNKKVVNDPMTMTITSIVTTYNLILQPNKAFEGPTIPITSNSKY